MVELLCLVFSFAVVYALTGRLRTRLLAVGRLDIPNDRSSHVTPTPRGGGLAISVVVSAAIVVLWLFGHVSTLAPMACVAGGVLVAVVGHIDDRRGLGPKLRLLVHAAAAALLVVACARVSNLSVFFPSIPAAATVTLLMLGIVWSINSFNFMDGIDGFAGSQAIFVAGAAAGLAYASNGESEWISIALVLTGASAGFLAWNWPPARIFMGDVGSGFLGYWLAALAIGLHLSEGLSFWAYVILASMFLADSTITLVRRILRGERWAEAHRSHAYQILSRKWTSHKKVTLLLWTINLFVLTPLAYVSTRWPGTAMWLAMVTLASISSGCIALGAGGRETRASAPNSALPP